MVSHQVSENLVQLDLNLVGLVVQATEAVEDVVISARNHLKTCRHGRCGKNRLEEKVTKP